MSAERKIDVSVIPGSKKDQIKSLLKANCTVTQVAAAVGVSQPYVSELLADPDFAAEVATHRIKLLADQSETDGKYDSIEKRLLAGLEEKLNQGVAFMKMQTILQAINTVNRAVRRGAGHQESVAPPSNIVQLIMPTVIVRQFQANQDNEVIKVGDQELISMSSKNVLQRLESANLREKIVGLSQSVPKGGQVYDHATGRGDGTEAEGAVKKATISCDEF